MSRNRMTIGLSSLRVKCSIGILPDEILNEQTITVDVCAEILRIDTSDVISSTLDYRVIKNLIESYAALNHISLVETLADRIVCGLMAFEGVTGVAVRITKIYAFAGDSSPVIQALSGTLAEKVFPHWG